MRNHMLYEGSVGDGNKQRNVQDICSCALCNAKLHRYTM